MTPEFLRIIDADSMIYRAGFATEGEPLSHALQVVKRYFDEIKDKYSDGEQVVLLTGDQNFRKDLNPEYKANRTGRKPEYFTEIKQYMVDVHDAMISTGLEADDVASVYAKFCRAGKVPHVVCSIDKDLRTFPGLKYNFVKKEEDYVSPAQAEWEFMLQILCGDKSDNIPGIGKLNDYTCKFLNEAMLSTFKFQPGLAVGPVRASHILEAVGNEVCNPLYSGTLERRRILVELLGMQEYDMDNLHLLWMTREITKDGERVPFNLERWCHGS